MSIALYKKGSTHVVKGVDCELLICDATDLDFYKDKGYSTSVNDLYEYKDMNEDIEQKESKMGGVPPKLDTHGEDVINHNQNKERNKKGRK